VDRSESAERKYLMEMRASEIEARCATEKSEIEARCATEKSEIEARCATEKAANQLSFERAERAHQKALLELKSQLKSQYAEGISALRSELD
jgi:hypothetical protein